MIEFVKTFGEQILNYGVLGLWTVSLLIRNSKLEKILEEISDNIHELNLKIKIK